MAKNTHTVPHYLRHAVTQVEGVWGAADHFPHPSQMLRPCGAAGATEACRMPRIQHTEQSARSTQSTSFPHCPTVVSSYTVVPALSWVLLPCDENPIYLKLL